MIWRLWCFAAGLPLGVLAVLALAEKPDLLAVEAGALAGGAALAVVASAIARARDDDASRGPHLAVASSVALLALPGLVWTLLGLTPGPLWLFAGCVLCCCAALYHAARTRGPVRFATAVGVVFAVPVLGALAIALVSALLVSLAAASPETTEERANTIYDMDASVETRALPRCEVSAATSRVLAHSGAHPRLGPKGRWLWFDASVDGLRQLHRMDLERDEIQCWTCGQPGNNMRPSPDPLGEMLLFDSDRFATWLDPTNTEIFWAPARGDVPGRVRRLTSSPGPDDHAVFGPSPAVVLWSKRAAGQYFLASASILAGHGGVLLGSPGVMASGGSRWVVPLAWSRNARAIVFARGNPYGGREVVIMDPATGRERSLSVEEAVAADFNADGGWLVVVGAQRDRVAGLLPARLGFVLGAFAERATRGAPLFRDTRVFGGATSAASLEVVPDPLETEAAPGRLALGHFEVGGLTSWGEPTGVAVSPDATRFVVGQRRRADGHVEERLVEVLLECANARVRGIDLPSVPEAS